MEFTIKQGGDSGTFKNTDAGADLPLTYLGPLVSWFRPPNTTGTIQSCDDIKDEPFTVSIRAGVWDWGSSACDLSSAKSDSVTISGWTNPKIVHTITTTATPAGGGTVTCNGGATTVADGSDVECTATANSGHTLETLEISDDVATPVTCNASPSCTAKLTGVKGKVTATATFKDSGGGGGGGGSGAVTGGVSPVPTMSEIGLLLSGIALAGAAAPALRRRERKERKRA